jgi:hypothetical protein
VHLLDIEILFLQHFQRISRRTVMVEREIIDAGPPKKRMWILLAFLDRSQIDNHANAELLKTGSIGIGEQMSRPAAKYPFSANMQTGRRPIAAEIAEIDPAL